MFKMRKTIKLLGALFTGMAMMLLILPTEAQAAPKKHTVTFIYGDRISQQEVSDGAYAKIPTDTSIQGYTFLGWSDSAVNVRQDKIILGMYANNIPYAPLTNSFSHIKKVNENMSAPFLPEWSITSPEMGVPGVTCIVRWYNSWDMQIFKTDVVSYGGTLPNPMDPDVEGIEFIGWEGNWNNVTEDRAIKAWGVKKEAEDESSTSDEDATAIMDIDADTKVETKEDPTTANINQTVVVETPILQNTIE